MQDALPLATGSDMVTGARAGEMGAGLQMEDTGAVTEVDVFIRPGAHTLDTTEEEEEAEGAGAEEELEEEGGVNWPLLSDPLLSLFGDGFFFIGFTLELLLLLLLLLLCCCWRHLARLFLNQTCAEKKKGVKVCESCSFPRFMLIIHDRIFL